MLSVALTAWLTACHGGFWSMGGTGAVPIQNHRLTGPPVPGVCLTAWINCFG